MKKQFVLPALLAASFLFACEPAGSSSSEPAGGSESSASSPDSNSSESENPSTEQGSSPLRELRKSQGRSTLPSNGTAKIAVVPVAFAPEGETTFGYTSLELARLRLGHFGTTGEGAQRSAVDFYDASSYGKLELGGEVLETVTLPSTLISYLQGVSTRGASEVISEIFDYVYDAVFVDGGVDPASYDGDGDGLIDGLSLAYSFTNETYLMDILTDSALQSAGLQLLVDGLLDQSLVPEGVGAAYWMCGNSDPYMSLVASSQAGTATFVSWDFSKAYLEVAQMLGLDALNDTVGDSAGNYRLPLGYTDLMDSATLDHNPFSKYLLGWIEPTKVYADALEGETTIELAPSSDSGDAILLAPEATGLYDEYLLIDHYEPTGNNAYDVSKGLTLLTEGGIRIYKIDARLVRGYEHFALYEGEPDYAATTVDGLGESVSYVYDFAYTNDSVDHYYADGIASNFPLVTILDRTGSNRHMANQLQLSSASLFQKGDTFGEDTGIPGFYSGYRFNGNGLDGEELGLTITVDSLSATSASLTIRRAD